MESKTWKLFHQSVKSFAPKREKFCTKIRYTKQAIYGSLWRKVNTALGQAVWLNIMNFGVMFCNQVVCYAISDSAFSKLWNIVERGSKCLGLSVPVPGYSYKNVQNWGGGHTNSKSFHIYYFRIVNVLHENPSNCPTPCFVHELFELNRPKS